MPALLFVQQYVQHDWSPAIWAILLTVLATAVTVGMALFIWGATRPKRTQFSDAADVDARTARS